MGEETVVTAPAAEPMPSAVENEVVQQLTAALSSRYGQALTDLVKAIQSGAPVNDGQAAAESALTAVLGRETAYSRLQFKRSAFEAKCTQSLLPPQDLKMGPMPVKPPAMPGPYVWEGFPSSSGKRK